MFNRERKYSVGTALVLMCASVLAVIVIEGGPATSCQIPIL